MISTREHFRLWRWRLFWAVVVWGPVLGGVASAIYGTVSGSQDPEVVSQRIVAIICLGCVGLVVATAVVRARFWHPESYLDRLRARLARRQRLGGVLRDVAATRAGIEARAAVSGDLSLCDKPRVIPGAGDPSLAAAVGIENQRRGAKGLVPLRETGYLGRSSVVDFTDVEE